MFEGGLGTFSPTFENDRRKANMNNVPGIDPTTVMGGCMGCHGNATYAGPREDFMLDSQVAQLAPPSRGRGPLELAAVQLSGTAREHAKEQMGLRRLSEATAAALRDSDLADVFRSWPHAPLSLVDCAMAVAELARADGATAWCMGIYSVSAWIVRRVFPCAVTDALMAPERRPLFAGTMAPGPNSLVAQGAGFRLDGRWRFVSGCSHADYVFVRVEPPGTSGGAQASLVLLTPDDYEIVDDWRFMGLQGSGSSGIAVRDRWIEGARVAGYDELGLAAGDRGAHAVEHRLPLRLLMRLPIAAVALGLARASLDHFTANQAQRVTKAGQVPRGFGEFQRRLGAAGVELDCAELLIARVCHEAEALARDRLLVTAALRARFARDLVSVVQRSAALVDTLVRVSGASELYDDRPLQRIFRDVFAVANHFSCKLEDVLEVSGGFALGVQPPEGTII